MTFDSKIAIIVREELAVWQKLNVTAFLAGGLAGCYKEIIGERYRDASGLVYGPLVRQPILIFSASGEELRRAAGRARDRGIVASIYTMQLFTTYNDATTAPQLPRSLRKISILPDSLFMPSAK